MSDSQPNAENPYSAPQLAQAELVPPIEAAELGPGELPCHRCGQPVPAKMVKCPRCGTKPLYDALELVVTAAVVFVMLLAMILGVEFRQVDPEKSWFCLCLGVGMAGVLFLVIWLFKKLKRGRW